MISSSWQITLLMAMLVFRMTKALPYTSEPGDHFGVMLCCKVLACGSQDEYTMCNFNWEATEGECKRRNAECGIISHQSDTITSMAPTVTEQTTSITTTIATAPPTTTTVTERNGVGCVTAQAVSATCNSYQLAKPVFEAAEAICDPKAILAITTLATTLMAFPATAVIGETMATAIGDIAWDCVFDTVGPKAVLEAVAGFEIELYCSLRQQSSEEYLRANCDYSVIFKRGRGYLTYAGIKRKGCPITMIPMSTDIDKALTYLDHCRTIDNGSTDESLTCKQHGDKLSSVLRSMKVLSDIRAQLGTAACDVTTPAATGKPSR